VALLLERRLVSQVATYRRRLARWCRRRDLNSCPWHNVT
jgi:hypothetical protein